MDSVECLMRTLHFVARCIVMSLMKSSHFTISHASHCPRMPKPFSNKLIDLFSLEPSSRHIQIANRHCETMEKTRFSLFLWVCLRLTPNHTLIFSRATDRNQTRTCSQWWAALHKDQQKCYQISIDSNRSEYVIVFASIERSVTWYIYGWSLEYNLRSDWAPLIALFMSADADENNARFDTFVHCVIWHDSIVIDSVDFPNDIFGCDVIIDAFRITKIIDFFSSFYASTHEPLEEKEYRSIREKDLIRLWYSLDVVRMAVICASFSIVANVKWNVGDVQTIETMTQNRTAHR